LRNGEPGRGIPFILAGKLADTTHVRSRRISSGRR
jgi:hypothetical protein